MQQTKNSDKGKKWHKKNQCITITTLCHQKSGDKNNNDEASDSNNLFMLVTLPLLKSSDKNWFLKGIIIAVEYSTSYLCISFFFCF